MLRLFFLPRQRESDEKLRFNNVLFGGLDLGPLKN